MNDYCRKFFQVNCETRRMTAQKLNLHLTIPQSPVFETSVQLGKDWPISSCHTIVQWKYTAESFSVGCATSRMSSTYISTMLSAITPNSLHECVVILNKTGNVVSKVQFSKFLISVFAYFSFRKHFMNYLQFKPSHTINFPQFLDILKQVGADYL